MYDEAQKPEAKRSATALEITGKVVHYAFDRDGTIVIKVEVGNTDYLCYMARSNIKESELRRMLGTTLDFTGTLTDELIHRPNSGRYWGIAERCYHWY